MCGIYSIFDVPPLYRKVVYEMIRTPFMLGRGRGPEHSILENKEDKDYFLGFHRLAINGLDEISNQPFHRENVSLICNGEIYNYKELIQEHELDCKTHSDCEVILLLYMKYGISKTLSLLDGVFAFVLVDDKEGKMYVSRDPFGVRPLYEWSMMIEGIDSMMFGFSSEMKMVCNEGVRMIKMKQFPPSSYRAYTKREGNWQLEEEIEYHRLNDEETIHDEEDAYTKIYEALENSVRKRVTTTERPIACLLSGGLDSSLITSLVKKIIDESGKQQILETYSIGLEGSEDLKYAREVAKFLNTKHTEVLLTEAEFLAAIPNVIYHIESYDTTTVRASVGNYLISKYISDHSDAKVIFNGDGSDEVCGGYLYFHMAPNADAFDAECKRLLKNIHYYDVLRSDRSISSNGLEPRTPFLDKEFVRTYLSISKSLRYDTTKTHCEKYLLRNAFSKKNILPPSVLWRTKEAFSDGVSSHTKSWYEIIQTFVEKYDISKKSLERKNTSLTMVPQTKEQNYYFNVYVSYYEGCENVIPEYWLPRFVGNAKDASARTLDIYKNKIHNTNILL